MKTTRIVIVLLFIINLVIALNRNRGFAYVNALTTDDLNPAECNKECIEKWTKPNKKFLPAELENGRFILKKERVLDAAFSDEDKIMRIAGYLYSKFHRQAGQPSAKLNSLQPLQQLQLLSEDTTEKLWCGNFQAMIGFLCTAAGLPNRYVEITSFAEAPSGGTHEVNEVYLEKNKKWVMTDATRNMLLIKNGDTPVSASEYFQYNLQAGNTRLRVLKTASNNSFIFDTLMTETKPGDSFFNKNFFLRYYYMTDLQQVYSPLQKLKRYLLPESWYAVYDPQNNYSNTRFRIKQFFAALLCFALLLYGGLFLKTKFPAK